MERSPQNRYISLLQYEKLLCDSIYVLHKQLVALLILTVHNLCKIYVG